MQKSKLGLVPAYLGLLVVGMSSVSSQAAIITTYENNLADWLVAVGGPTSTIDFEDHSGIVTGDEFSAEPGGPVFELQAGNDMFSGNTNPALFSPTSGVNAFFPRVFTESGILAIGEIRMVLDVSVSGIGASFLDVGPAFELTGFDLDNDGILDVKFSNSFPNQPAVFLGFTTDTPLSTIDIHFGGTNESGDDSVAIDDLSYPFAFINPIPEPASLALLGLGIAGLGFARRKKSA